MLPAAFDIKVAELQLRMLVEAVRSRPSKHATPAGEGRRYRERQEARDRLRRPDEFSIQVNELTGAQRHAWAKARYPGLRDRDPKGPYEFSSARLRALLDRRAEIRAVTQES